MEATEKRLYTCQEAGVYLGVCSKTVHRLIDARKIPAVQFSRRPMIDVRDLEKFVTQNKA